MNMNKVAVLVARLEGKKKSLNIADIKEVMKCVKKVAACHPKARAHMRKYFNLNQP